MTVASMPKHSLSQVQKHKQGEIEHIVVYCGKLAVKVAVLWLVRCIEMPTHLDCVHSLNSE